MPQLYATQAIEVCSIVNPKKHYPRGILHHSTECFFSVDVRAPSFCSEYIQEPSLVSTPPQGISTHYLHTCMLPHTHPSTDGELDITDKSTHTLPKV